MPTLPFRWRPPDALARAALVIGIVVLGVPVILRALGFDVSPAIRALFDGSLGSTYAFTSGTLVRATPPDKITYAPLEVAEKDPIHHKYGPFLLNTMTRDNDSGLLAARQLVIRFERK